MITNRSSNIPVSQAYSYVCWAYIFAGFSLAVSSMLYRIKGVEKALSFLLPTPVMGPVISLIGLELASSAATDAGLHIVQGSVDKSAVIISLATLLSIILVSVTKRKFLKNASILIGLTVGYIVSIIVLGPPSIDWMEFSKVRFPAVDFPFFSIPSNLPSLLLSVIPASLVVSSENYSRVLVIGRMIDADNPHVTQDNNANVQDKRYSTSLLAHGVATMVAGLLGSVPNTLYAENIAVMNLHNIKMEETERKPEKDKFIQQFYNPFSCYPYIIAAIFSVISSMVGALQQVLLSIPKPVIGGVELFLFGLISAPGIQLLVDERVNYKKISNQILTASVLISGISGLTLNLHIVQLEGMSLGLVIGLILNLFFKFLQWTGKLNEALTFEELFELCVKSIGFCPRILRIGGMKQVGFNDTDIYSKSGVASERPSEWVSYDILLANDLLAVLIGKTDSISISDDLFSAAYIHELIKNSKEIILADEDSKPVLCLQKTANNQYVYVNSDYLTIEQANNLMNDYSSVVDDGFQGYIRLEARGEPSTRVLKRLVMSLKKQQGGTIANV